MNKLLKYCQTGDVIQADNRNYVQRKLDELSLPVRNLSQQNLTALKKGTEYVNKKYPTIKDKVNGLSALAQYIPYKPAQLIGAGLNTAIDLYDGNSLETAGDIVSSVVKFSPYSRARVVGKSISGLFNTEDMLNKEILKESNKKQQGGINNMILAEKGEVIKDVNGNINQVSKNAPTHDDGFITNVTGNKFKKASYNNGGVEVNDTESVLSATHENRNTNDKSYSEQDEIIKIKPNEFKELGKEFKLSVKTNKSISPSKAFELLREAKEKQLIKLNKFQLKELPTQLEKASFEENSKLIKYLPKDNDLYDRLLYIQETKKQMLNY